MEILRSANESQHDRHPEQTLPKPGGIQRRPRQQSKPDSELLSERFVLRQL
jgi:hypothetical protein